MAMLITPIATYMNNRLGFRVPLFLGLFLESGSFVAASFAKELWQLALTQGVFFGFGMGLLFGPSISIPPQWFNKRRALATGQPQLIEVEVLTRRYLCGGQWSGRDLVRTEYKCNDPEYFTRMGFQDHSNRDLRHERPRCHSPTRIYTPNH